MWLRLADCLNSLGDLEGAEAAYRQVVEMAPSHIGARMSLSTLQSHLGKHEEALKALNRGKLLIHLITNLYNMQIMVSKIFQC